MCVDAIWLPRRRVWRVERGEWGLDKQSEHDVWLMGGHRRGQKDRGEGEGRERTLMEKKKKQVPKKSLKNFKERGVLALVSLCYFAPSPALISISLW